MDRDTIMMIVVGTLCGGVTGAVLFFVVGTIFKPQGGLIIQPAARREGSGLGKRNFPSFVWRR